MKDEQHHQLGSYVDLFIFTWSYLIAFLSFFPISQKTSGAVWNFNIFILFIYFFFIIIETGAYKKLLIRVIPEALQNSIFCSQFRVLNFAFLPKKFDTCEIQRLK